MKVTRKFKTPLERQIAEALEIERKTWSSDELLNKKGEWNGTKVPRLRLESVKEIVNELEVDGMRSNNEERLRVGKLKKDWKKTQSRKRRLE